MILQTGKRVVLRDMALEDVESWGHWMGPGHRWRALDGPYYREEPTTQWVQEAMAGHRARLSGDVALPAVRERAVVASLDSDAFLGQVSRYWISEETNWPALGVAIYDDTKWGRGYGYEALGLWSDYLFQSELDFVRLDLRTWSGNVGMMRLAEKLGYQQEACFRRARIVDGVYYDGLGYGVLREEWARRYPEGFAAAL